MGWQPGHAVIAGSAAHCQACYKHFAPTSTTSVTSAKQNFALNGLTALKAERNKTALKEKWANIRHADLGTPALANPHLCFGTEPSDKALSSKRDRSPSKAMILL